MACPYFYPTSKAEGVRQPARAPLGAMYEGRCEIGGSAGSDACNFGYAAGHCESFPPCDAVGDAVRFTMLEGRATYVLEKNYSPVRFGAIDALEGALARQAEVFVSWMGR